MSVIALSKNNLDLIKNSDKKVLIDYFVDKEEVNQEEAVFCIGVIEQSLNQVVLKSHLKPILH